jgi:hypothetical protein
MNANNQIEEIPECPVCMMPYDDEDVIATKLGNCNHEICKACIGRMIQQDVYNGCVGVHYQTKLKVAKCPVCRKCDNPSQEALIAEIVRLRRLIPGHSGYQPPAPAPRPVPAPRPAPAPRPVPAPAPAPVRLHPDLVEVERQANPRPYNAQTEQHLVFYGRVMALYRGNPNSERFPQPVITFETERDGIRIQHGIPRHNIFCQENVADLIQMWSAGTRLYTGRTIYGHYYHDDTFIPDRTEGGSQARRVCNNRRCPSPANHRTARRCSRGCGQFICNRCETCHDDTCITHNTRN